MRSGVIVGVLLLLVAANAHAADKKKCLDAAPRGQELRDSGKLVEAREEFLVCADPGCPPPVPSYCAEWLEDLKKKIPSIVLRLEGKDTSNATLTIDVERLAVVAHRLAVDR